jgi:hypothetical protein
VCGCTDDDCRQCIEKTGAPCYWIESDLCSACRPSRDFAGTLVRFAHQSDGPVHRVSAVDPDGMVSLHDMVGWFAPHLFVVAVQ